MDPRQPPAHSASPSVPEGADPGRSAPAGPARAALPPPSRQTLEGVRRRDSAALAEFFERYFDHVYGLVHRLLGDRPAAEDVTQEVFLKVHRAAEQLDPDRDPQPWLTAIACNACRDVWRSGAYRLSRRSDSIEAGPAVESRLPRDRREPEELLLAHERELLVREAIARLPDTLREVVLLYNYQGLSHQEVAELLGIHPAAARKRYSRALEALGKMLRETFGT